MNKLFKMSEIYPPYNTIPRNLDFFICAANSNPRCHKIPSQIKHMGCTIQHNIVFDYAKLRPEINSKNHIAIENYAFYESLESVTMQKCESEDDDVEFFANSAINENTSIGIDITGFTIPDIFRIMYVLKKIKNLKSAHIFYTEPEHYLFKKDIFSTYNYLSGERTYKSIPEYYVTGDFEKELLVCFLGFDTLVSGYVFDKAMPYEAVAVNGFPAFVPKLKDISLLNNYTFLSSNIDQAHKFYTRANNPFSSYNTLCDIRSKFPNYLMNICVLGTKPMALGACLFSLDNMQNVKVTYPYPQQYELKTTEASTRGWHYVVNML